MKGLLNGILKCICRICSLKIQESPHSSNPSAARTLLQLPHILIQDVKLSYQVFCVQEYDSSSFEEISGIPVCTAEVPSVSRPDPNLCAHSFGSRKKGSKLTMPVKHLLLKNGCNNGKETTVSA
jgi:hypothetical protein